MSKKLHDRSLALAWLLILAPLLAEAQLGISSFTPGYGSPGDAVAISGGGFSNPVLVKFNGVTDATAGATSGSLIQARVPAGSTNGFISVQTSTEGPVQSGQQFIVIGAGPYVANFNPTNSPVFINGAHFTGTTAVKFSGSNGTINTLTDQEISVTPPANVTTGPITVVATTGSFTTSSDYYGSPSISGFSPASGRTGTNVTINGRNFLGATLVWFNNLTVVPTVLNNTQLVATVPASATTGAISVVAPAGSITTSSNFVVQPTITTFSPTFGAVGTNVTINGANFNVGTPVVTFNGVTSAVPTGVTFNSLVAVVPAKATTGPIRVITTDGAATSLSLFYLPPRITGFSPSNSAPGTTVTLNGTNFTDAISLSFNGVNANITSTSSNSLQATVPGGFTTGPLTLITPGGTNSTSSIAQSNFYAAPVITSFSPVHGLPGTNVTILGTNFLGTTLITFNGIAGTSLVISNNNAARITVPATATTGPIALTAPAGTATTATSFFLDYDPLLSINATTPPLIVLSWPGTFFTYALQANTDLAVTSGWANVTTTPVFTGGSNVVTETNHSPMLYYRLKR